MTLDARIQRVHRAVMFIEPRLFTALTAEDVTRAVGGSVYQLHRLFTEVYGISIMAYIRARRLTEGARMLRDSQRDVLSIAIDCRYTSQAAFTRAFRRQFQVPPGAWRRGEGAGFSSIAPATAQELVHRDRLEREPSLTWLHADRRLHGIRARVHAEELDGFHTAQQTLADLVGEQHEAVGIASSQQGALLEFFLGVDEPPEPRDALVTSSLKAGLYAVFHHRGPAETVRHSIAFFAQTWDTTPALKLGDRGSAEVFQLADRHSPQLELALWIPVEPA